MYVTVSIISLVILGVADASADQCILMDDRIQSDILNPFQEILKLSSSEFIRFGEGKTSQPALEAAWDGGFVGNFSTIHLDTLSGNSSAQVCTNGNVSRLALEMNLALDLLRVNFNNFTMSVPIITTLPATAIFLTTGSRVFGTLTASKDLMTNECSVSVDDIEFKTWGTVELNYKGNYEKNFLAGIFFNVFRDKIIRRLHNGRVERELEDYTRTRLFEAIDNHKAVLCDFMK